MGPSLVKRVTAKTDPDKDDDADIENYDDEDTKWWKHKNLKKILDGQLSKSKV
jgi:hypothetical protein